MTISPGRALRAGAVGFLLKDVTSEGLADAVRRAANGAPAVLTRMMDHLATSPPDEPRLPAGLDELSDRERDVLAMIGAGSREPGAGSREPGAGGWGSRGRSP